MTALELFAVFGLKVDKESFKAGANAIQGLKRVALTLAAGMGIKSLASMTEHAAEAGTHIIALSKQFGISTQAVQEWSYVAKQSGSNINELGVGISQFERNLRQFSEGRGAKLANEALVKFGFTQSEVAKLMQDPDGLNKALFQTADKLKGMGNNMASASAVTVLFGRRARGIAGDLSQGGDALKAQIQHLHAIGGVVDEDKLRNLKQFNNDLNDIRTAFHGLIMQVVGALAPALSHLAKSAAQWIGTHKELISGALTAAVKGLALAFEAVGVVIDGLYRLVKRALGGDDGAFAILIGIATFIGAILIPSLWGMAAPVIAASLPFLAIAAIVGLIAFGIIKLIKHAGDIKRALGDAGHYVLEKWEAFVDFLKNIPHLIAEAFRAGAEFIKEKMEAALNWIKNKAHEVSDDIKSFLGIGQSSSPVFVQAAKQRQAMAASVQQNPDAGIFQRFKDVQSRMNESAPAAANKNTVQNTNINVAPTTVTINGVKGAAEAKDGISDAIDRMHRNALAATGGNVP